MQPFTKISLQCITAAATFFCAGLLVGQVAHFNLGETQVSFFKETRLAENFKYINPLLECSSNLSNSIPVNKLQNDISTYIQKLIAQKLLTAASVYYHDLNNGPTFNINGNALFSPASLIKVPMLIAVLRVAEDDPKILTKELSVDDVAEYDNQDIVPGSKLELHKKYKVEDIVTHMIVYSDNVAYDLLLKNIVTPSKLGEVYNDLGVDITRAAADPGGNVISIKDYSSFFRILYNASYLSKEMSERALSILAQVKFSEGLVAGVPGGTVVAHKFGERAYAETSEVQLHDCGIIYKPNKPYLLCVMTRANKPEALISTISNISQMVYSFNGD